MEKPTTVSEFLNQDEWWVNKDGWIRIADMEYDFRRRAAGLLIRRARFFEIWELDELLMNEEIPEADEVQEFLGRVAAPANFMRRMPLYKRLIQGGADPERWLTRDDD